MPFRYMASACSILESGALAMHLTSFRVVLEEDPGALSFRRREMGNKKGLPSPVDPISFLQYNTD